MKKSKCDHFSKCQKFYGSILVSNAGFTAATAIISFEGTTATSRFGIGNRLWHPFGNKSTHVASVFLFSSLKLNINKNI